MEIFFPLNNGYILEDSSHFFYPMAKMLMLTIQTSSLVNMLTCSDEVKPSTALFIASQQLQTKADIHPTEISVYSTLVFPPSKMLLFFNKTRVQWQQTKLIFLLYRTKKLQKYILIKSLPPSLEQLNHGWQHGQNVVKPETSMY